MSSQIAPQELGLPIPARPGGLTDTQCLTAAMDWVDDNIPFKQNGIYRPDKAWLRGGNCYAQALGYVTVMQEWDIAAGVVLDKDHAHIVAATDGGVFFPDPIYSEIRMASGEDSRRSGYRLEALYKGMLAERLQDGVCTLYFFREGDNTTDWHAIETGAIRGQTDLTDEDVTHIIVDGDQAADMLLGTGDLKRYEQNDVLRYAEAFHDLRQYVPDFIPLSRPLS